MMSTEWVRIWCKPANGGRHNIGTVVSDVANGLPYYTVKYKGEVTGASETGDFQSFAKESSDALVDNASMTYHAYCPGCKAPIELSSRALQSHLEEAQREGRPVEMNVRPNAALEDDNLWAKAHEYNDWKVSDEQPGGRIYPDAKNRLRTDPRDETR